MIMMMSLSLFGCGGTNGTVNTQGVTGGETVVAGQDETAGQDAATEQDDTKVQDTTSEPVVTTEETEAVSVSYQVTDINNYSAGTPDITDVSETEKQLYFYRDGLKIFGKLYLPEGEGPFPVLVMQPGFRGSQALCSSLKDKFIENGIACLTYDCIGAASPSKSDGMIFDMTFMTEIMDTFVVLDSITSISQLDADNIFVYGHSVGGLVVTYAATHRPDDVKGIIAVEPSYQMRDEFDMFFPDDSEMPESFTEPLYGGRQMAVDAKAMDPYEKMEEYKNSVLIFAGGKAPSIGAEAIEYLEKAVDLFPNAKLVSVEEADHSFMGDAQEKMLDTAVTFIKDNLD